VVDPRPPTFTDRHPVRALIEKLVLVGGLATVLTSSLELGSTAVGARKTWPNWSRTVPAALSEGSGAHYVRIRHQNTARPVRLHGSQRVGGASRTLTPPASAEGVFLAA